MQDWEHLLLKRTNTSPSAQKNGGSMDQVIVDRNTAKQNKVVDSEKNLKATVWKKNTEMEIPSLGQR